MLEKVISDQKLTVKSNPVPIEKASRKLICDGVEQNTPRTVPLLVH